MNAAEYRRHAVDCLKFAYLVTDPKNKALLIEMANAWKRLADQADKNSKVDLMYDETPRLRHLPPF
jgi:hypothetical protein